MAATQLYSYFQQEHLSHHGIKGQRWGIRRYQNADGSLTAAGKKRYDRGTLETNTKKEDEHRLSNRQKLLRNSGIGVAITTVALGTVYAVGKKIGNFRLEDLPDNLVTKGKTLFQRAASSEPSSPIFTARDRELIDLLSEIADIIADIEK